MKRIANPLSIVAAALVLAAAMPQPASAQPGPRVHAEANEAVYVDQFGNKKYRLPPAPMRGDGTPQSPAPTRPHPFVEAAYMIETSDGLVECSTVWRNNCRPSTYGTGVELTRWWVVLRSGVWYTCFGPARGDRCIAPVAFNGTRGDKSEDAKWATPPRS